MILPAIWPKRLVLVVGSVLICLLLMIQCIKNPIQFFVSLQLLQPIRNCWHHSGNTLRSGRNKPYMMGYHLHWQQFCAWPSTDSGLLISFNWLHLKEIYEKRSYGCCIPWLTNRLKFDAFLMLYPTT